jgi:ribosome-associated toxin RatA of RatAB toxin-antitoxin module
VSGISGQAESVVDATVPACAAVLLDFERYPEWYPFVDELRVLEGDASAGGVVIEASARLAVRSVRYRLRYRYDEPAGRLWAEYLGGDLKRLETEWRLAERPGGSTQAQLSLKGEVNWVLDRLLAPVRDAARREMIDDAVAALKRRVEGI